MRVFKLKGAIRAGKGKRFKAGQHVTDQQLPLETLLARAARGEAEEVMPKEQHDAIRKDIERAGPADLVPLLAGLGDKPKVADVQAAADAAGLKIKVTGALVADAQKLAAEQKPAA